MATRPKKHRIDSRGTRPIYPWFYMSIGDWFPVEDRNRVSAAASKIAKFYSLRFSVLKQKDGTLRCYRVE